MAIDSGFNFQTRSSYCCCCSSVQLFFDLYVCIQRTGLMHMFRLVFFFFWWRSVAETALQTGLEYVLQSFYSNESIITGKFLPRCHRKLGGKDCLRRSSAPFVMPKAWKWCMRETCSQRHWAPVWAFLPPWSSFSSFVSIFLPEVTHTFFRTHTWHTHTRKHMNAETNAYAHKTQTHTDAAMHAETYTHTHRHAHNSVFNVKSLPRV